MEIFEKLTDIIVEHWDKVVLILTTPIISGLSIWGIIKIILNILSKKKSVESKFTELKAENQALKSDIINLNELINNLPTMVLNGIKEFEKDKELAKQKVYDAIMNGKEQVAELQTDINKLYESAVEKGKEVVEETITEIEEVKTETQEQQVEELNDKKKVVIINGK